MRALFYAALAALCSLPLQAAEFNTPDLPPHAEVDIALKNHVNVLLADTSYQTERVNQQKWGSGSYEFNLRVGAAQRRIVNAGQKLNEWDVALERPLRLPNKAALDTKIGVASMERAEFALGDARHEAGRELLHLWFNWQREQAQERQWELQVNLLDNQAKMIEKRVKAGDAAHMEMLQANAAASQARVSLKQAELRMQLASDALTRPFPMLNLPEDPRSGQSQRGVLEKTGVGRQPRTRHGAR
jgi:outer membrane protein, heavy metal efflux system